MSSVSLAADTGHQGGTRGLLYGFLGVAAFSLTLPMTSIAVPEFGAAQVIIWRGLMATFAAITILLALRPQRPVGVEWRHLALCAFGTVFGFPFFTTLAMQTVSASHGAVVIGLLPLATAIAGVLVSNERPSKGFWLASLLGTALTLTFVWRQAEGGLAIGHVYMLLAVVTAGLGYAYGGRLARRLRGWVVACWSLVISLPVLLVAVSLNPSFPFDAAPQGLGALFYLALISQLGGFFAWYRGMALAGIARVSQVQLLQLFMTFGFAVLLLGEPWDAETIAFGAAVVATVWITTRLRIRG